MDCSPPGSPVYGDSPGKNTRVGWHALFQGIFPTQGSNPGLLHCEWILYCLCQQVSPRILERVSYPFSRGSSRPRNQTRVSCIARRFSTSWATREALSSHRHAQLLTQFLAPSLSGKLGETAENSRLLIMDWSFWLLVPTQSPSRSPLRVTSVEQKTRLVLLSLRSL